MGRRGRMVFGFITAYIYIQSVPIYITTNTESEPRSGNEYSKYHYYMIKFVSDLRQIGGFLQVLRFPPDHHDITEILLKVALNTINLSVTI